MISPEFNFLEFISTVKDRDKFDNKYSFVKSVEVVPANAPLNYTLIIIIAVVLIVVYWFYRRRKKK